VTYDLSTLTKRCVGRTLQIQAERTRVAQATADCWWCFFAKACGFFLHTHFVRFVVSVCHVADVLIYGGFGSVVGAWLRGMDGRFCVEKLRGLKKS